MSKDYGQFCGLAKAAGVLGERWALLVARDLSVTSMRFTDLHQGLPGIPTSLLTTRLRELEAAGVVERQVAEQPGRGAVYALTAYGKELQPALDALGRWGAQRMSAPEPDDVVTDGSLAAALRTAYKPTRSIAATYQVHAGPATAWATAEGRDVVVGTGQPTTTPDLIIHSGSQLRLLLAGRLSPQDALGSGEIEIEGSIADFEAFSKTFHVPLGNLAL